ncbi:MAG: sugar ABC transporter permease, partial [Anaerolineaceae bacterium]|nr:sugar ABC transporter permease [Anaerolineaceae bacterium]
MKKSTNLYKKESRTAWLISMPALIGLGVFVILPLILGTYWSFTNKRLISSQPPKFVGFQNYDRLLSINIISLEPEMDSVTGEIQLDSEGNIIYPRTRDILNSTSRYDGYREWFAFDTPNGRNVVIAKDPTFMRALLNTFLFVFVIVPGQGGLALIMALFVNQRLKGVNIFRTTYFSPVVTSMAVLAIVWKFLYNPDEGLINRFLTIISFGHIHPPGWLIDANTALLAIIILSAWQAAGFQMVIFLAGLQGIPIRLYEAAQIDGANAWQQFRFVTLPQLRNTIIFVIISTTILAFRLFTQVDVLTQGGPQDSTVSIVYYIVEQGFRQQKIGYGSAITLLFFM